MLCFLTKKNKGFTLVELLVVVIIVGILAAVAIPMYQGATDRSKASEAVVALGTIRSALRVYYAEHAVYPVHADTVQVDSLGLDLSSDDLLGRYFDNSDYSYTGDATTFMIIATGGTDPDTAPRADEVDGAVRTMDEDGDLGSR
ncbi:prepilin-type N-terminal cleavage/methylation domain-containing protein [Candidatus Falkowbacteria bacterium]|nr:prepilin-type N-terminal cleavage/methylation domain-containing protein [Candidatus Falkowbacteria bacterium]